MRWLFCLEPNSYQYGLRQVYSLPDRKHVGFKIGYVACVIPRELGGVVYALVSGRRRDKNRGGQRAIRERIHGTSITEERE